MEHSHPKPRDLVPFSKPLAGLGWPMHPPSLPAGWVKGSAERFSAACPQTCILLGSAVLTVPEQAAEAPGAQSWLPPTPGLQAAWVMSPSVSPVPQL